jgi:hypothetical protein
MLNRVVRFCALFLIVIAGPAHSLVIDRLNVSTVFGYPVSHYPADYRFIIFGVPYSYELSNGETRTVGAGWIPYTEGKVTRETVVGDSLEIEFGSFINWAKGEGTLLYHLGQVWDYGYSTEWTEGQLIAASPVVLRATVGSNVATLEGLATILFNNPSNAWGDPADFVPYGLPEGTVIPYSITYTLLNDVTWAPGLLNTIFDYQISGTLDFTGAQAVPEPGLLLPLLLFALLALRPGLVPQSLSSSSASRKPRA